MEHFDNLKTLQYRGYRGTIQYSEADKCFFGKVMDMTQDCITYEVETLEELKADFPETVDDYIRGCEAHGIVPRIPNTHNNPLDPR